MDRNRSRSSKGTDGFDASSNTRQLKASQLSSRLKNRFGPVVSALGSATGEAKGELRKSAWVMLFPIAASLGYQTVA
jgi:hypothetical protein